MEREVINLGRVAFNPRGKWAEDAEYKKLDTVFHIDSTYYAKEDNVGEAPSKESSIWGAMATGGNVNNAADEEDLTAVEENGSAVIKINDRLYNPDNFSGNGYKILRKNVKNIDLAVVKVTVDSVPTTDGEISFTINNVDSHITLSKDTHNTTALAATAISEALATDHEDYDVVAEENVITLTRKHSGIVEASAYDVNETGMTLALEDSTKTVKRSILTSTMMNQSNTIYEVRYDFDLDGETLNVSDNCVLKFEGGSINNGRINLNGCKIKDGKITAFPTSAPYHNTFYTSDFCISKDSDPHFNTLMAQAMLNLERINIIFDIEGKIVFDNELHWKCADICGLQNSMNIYKTYLNFPNSRGIVGDSVARCSIRDLSISALKDAISVPSAYIIYFDSLGVHSKEGSCFVGNIATMNFEVHFNNIVASSAGKYCFDHFCGNTTTWENINIQYARKSAFNYCCGSITGCNGCWNFGIDTPHFLTMDSSEFNDRASYMLGLSLKQCNIEGYTDILFDMTDKSVGQISLWLGEKVSLYNNSSVDGKLTKPYIKANGLILKSSVWLYYSASSWAEGVYPVMTSFVGNSMDNFYCQGDIDVYVSSIKKVLSIRTDFNNLKDIRKTTYYSGLFEKKRGVHRNQDLDCAIMRRLYVESQTYSYPSDKDVVQLPLGDYQSFTLTRPTDEDVEETKVVQLNEAYITNGTAIYYGGKRKFHDFLTVYNACKKTSFLIRGEEYYSIEHPTIAPGECCTFENINGLYILHSINKYRHIRSTKSMTTSDGAPSVNGMAIYCSDLKKFGISNGGKWLDVFGNPITTRYAFPTVNRPTDIVTGTCYFDTTLGKPIWWNGSKWIDKDGNPADAKQSGTTENRPTGVKVGYIYKDTTLNKLIIWNGGTWVNMDGSSLDADTRSDEISKEVADDDASVNEGDTTVVNEEDATETENEVTEDPT